MSPPPPRLLLGETCCLFSMASSKQTPTPSDHVYRSFTPTPLHLRYVGPWGTDRRTRGTDAHPCRMSCGLNAAIRILSTRGPRSGRSPSTNKAWVGRLRYYESKQKPRRVGGFVSTMARSHCTGTGHTRRVEAQSLNLSKSQLRLFAQRLLPCVGISIFGIERGF